MTLPSPTSLVGVVWSTPFEVASTGFSSGTLSAGVAKLLESIGSPIFETLLDSYSSDGASSDDSSDDEANNEDNVRSSCIAVVGGGLADCSVVSSLISLIVDDISAVCSPLCTSIDDNNGLVVDVVSSG